MTCCGFSSVTGDYLDLCLIRLLRRFKRLILFLRHCKWTMRKNGIGKKGEMRSHPLIVSEVVSFVLACGWDEGCRDYTSTSVM